MVSSPAARRERALSSERAIAVSYVVPAYQAADTLAGAVRSALAQEGVHIEVVVVDDGSRDATAQIAAGLAREDARVRLLRMARNGGVSNARNAGIAAARGRFVGVLDADDALLPGRTRALLALAESAGADLVADNLQRVDATGEPIDHAFPPGLAPYAFFLEPARYLDDNAPMLARFASGYLKPLVRRERLAARAAPYDPLVPMGEDFLLCLEILLEGGTYVVSSAPGYRYAVRPGSLSHRLAPGDIEALRAGTERLRARHAATIAAEPVLAAAFDGYLARLERVHAFLGCVDEARDGGLVTGARAAAARPATWSLVTRYGLEAIANRLKARGPTSSAPTSAPNTAPTSAPARVRAAEDPR